MSQTLKTLRGVYPHPRAGEPLAACAALWRAKTGVAIAWQPQGAENLKTLARTCDLLAIDHAQIGQAVRDDVLLPLNRPDRVPELIRLANQSVGESFTSYRLRGDQWALPIEAASHIQAWRPDRLAGPVATWDDLLDLARARRVLLPMRPPHALLLFYTLAANLGQPAGTRGAVELIEPEFGAGVLDRVRALAALLDPACYDMDAAAVLDRIAAPGAAEHCAPYIEGAVGYARAGRLAFADIPAAGAQGPVGATLGGAGIAVSAFTSAPDAAVAFAFWLAGADVQRGPYADAGGQPANALAWGDDALNAAAGNFFRTTRPTLEGAWVRPRHDGYLPFQQAAAERINAGLRASDSGEVVVAELNRIFAASFM